MAKVADREALASESEGESGSDQTRFYQILDDYANHRAMFVELLEALSPHASALDTVDVRFAELSRIFDELGKPQRKRALEILRTHETPKATMLALLDAFNDEPWIGRLIVTFKNTLDRPRRFPILLNGLLTTAVSAFESHLAALTTEFLRIVPQALEATSKDRGKEFSLAELKSMSSIQDAVDIAISRRVDELLFGSFAEWRKFFVNNLNIDFKDLAIDWTEVEEVIQRRHVLVHNSGRASQRYVRSLPPGHDVKVGDRVSIDDAYVLSAIDNLFALGYLVGQAAWRKFSKSTSPYFKLQNVTYQLLTGSRWRVTKKFCAYGLQNPENAGDAAIHQVNLWLSIRGLEGVNAISREVEAWDVSASEDRFKMAKFCLLEDLDAAFPLIQQLFESGELSGEDLLEWPLLSSAREDPRFAVLMPSINRSIADETEAAVLVNGRSRVFHTANCPRIGKDSTSVTREVAMARGGRQCRICGDEG